MANGIKIKGGMGGNGVGKGRRDRTEYLKRVSKKARRAQGKVACR